MTSALASTELDQAARRGRTDALAQELAAEGFQFVPAQRMRELLAASGPEALSDWPAFEASWNDMPLDTYMRDGGRYRRRRHATFSARSGDLAPTLEPHQPHYQSLDYNPLNGGMARYFQPIAPAILAGSTLSSILAMSCELFGRLLPEAAWHIELHQFRIEARHDEVGNPTPEGVHRDGVNYVLVMMVKRTNIASGTTTIHDPSGRELHQFTLTDPFDTALVDDARCLHGVTPVQPRDLDQPAYRDVLVVTFRRK
jgi:hypothetical protein